MKRVLEAKGGSIVIKMAPAVTTAQEESDLARMLEGLERYRAMSRGAEARGRTVTVSP